MNRPVAAIIAGGVLLGAAALAGCADNNPPEGQPSFYRSLTSPGAALDVNAAQSMISGYRSNNGLGPVTVDPELMRLASEQAHAMAARDKLDHAVARPFQDRIEIPVSTPAWRSKTFPPATIRWPRPSRAGAILRRTAPTCSTAGVTRMGIAAVYAPQSKFKIYWALILAVPDQHHG